jgi:hypothetical protein
VGFDVELLGLISAHWSAIAGTASLLGTVAVLWLTANFPRRKEFEDRDRLMRERLESQERRIDSHDLLIEKMAGRLENIEDRLKSIDEKLHWRFAALENQVTILLRGHLEWEEK